MLVIALFMLGGGIMAIYGALLSLSLPESGMFPVLLGLGGGLIYLGIALLTGGAHATKRIAQTKTCRSCGKATGANGSN